MTSLIHTVRTWLLIYSFSFEPYGINHLAISSVADMAWKSCCSIQISYNDIRLVTSQCIPNWTLFPSVFCKILEWNCNTSVPCQRPILVLCFPYNVSQSEIRVIGSTKKIAFPFTKPSLNMYSLINLTNTNGTVALVM